MSYTNSSLATYTNLSPFCSSPRNQPITKVTWHHMAGVLSLEEFDAIVHTPGRDMSANYAIDKDARVGLFCNERDRSWCSSSPWNDNRAVTLEISNSSTGGNWPISDKVYQKAIDLTVDICKRNGIKQLTYTGDQYGSLTFHRFFTSTLCLPLDSTYVLSPAGWVSLSSIKIGDMVAVFNRDNKTVKFDRVQNKVEPYMAETFAVGGLEATIDHNVLVYNDDDEIVSVPFADVIIGKKYDAFLTANEDDICAISARGFDNADISRCNEKKVSCITVETGYFVIRQNDNITIVGNCPGPYIFNKAQEICAKVNAKLNSSTNVSNSNNNNTSTNVVGKNDKGIKVGDLVSISSDAIYYTNESIPSWIKEEKWYIKSISGDRAVLGFNEAKTKNIISPISTKYLTIVATNKTNLPYTKQLKSTDKIYVAPGGKISGNIGTSGIFTIIQESVVNGVKYGKLKSGVGWVSLSNNNSIKKGDKVRVVKPIQYGTNKTFNAYVSTYYVLEINGDRVVISSDGKNVTAAINISNIQKI